MSASYLVDLGNTTNLNQYGCVSIGPANGVGASPASGEIVGNVADMLYVNSFTNLLIAGGVSLSGPFQVAVQTSDSPLSGSFTDPTSGMPASAMPTSFLSGGVVWVNSGQSVSGSPFTSGISWGAAFQRPHRYARARILSGSQTNAPIVALLLGQLKTDGSGAGFSQSPSSIGNGTVQV